MKKVNLNSVMIIIFIIIYSFFSILILSPWTKEQIMLPLYSEDINGTFFYQIITFSITFVFLTAVFLLRKSTLKKYFKIGKIESPIIPEPIVGITPQKNETWKQIGRNFAIIITLVTIIVMYFLNIRGNDFTSSQLFSFLPFVFIFSLSNAFVEETIYRIGVISAFDGIISNKQVAIVSGLIFGVAHYFGMPGAFIGVLVAGFLGWFLAKSILETKGFFWAYLIHFLQDFVIFFSLFMF